MLRPSLFFNKDAAFSPKTLLNKGSGAAIFLQNLKNLSVQLFCRIPVNDLSWIRSSWTGDMHKIYKKKTLMPKCDFNKVAKQLQFGCSPANLLYIFRAPFRKNTSGRLLLLNTCNRNYSAQNILWKVMETCHDNCVHMAYWCNPLQGDVNNWIIFIQFFSYFFVSLQKWK